ncbi:MAG TPA: hypothetical protein VM286_09365 [Candidatus Thermoplasmatota archaeon]|nr:hypothetical protein [Candidatus Thermoplasmatota archaeon]
MRILFPLVAVLTLTLVLVPDATASFGQSGAPAFTEFAVPAATGASEPTLGIPWTTDSVFYHAGVHTYRARFDAAGKPTWADVTPPYQVPQNLDPMIYADVTTGRVFAGGLLGPCSEMMISDDDGATWLPSINMCSGSNFDHQTVGTGPPAGPLPVTSEGGHVAYYCAQGGTISCARSLDGGQVWGPFVDVPGACHGFHGHLQVNPRDGFVAVPTGACGERHGFLSTADGGLTWKSNEVPGTEEWANGFDPSLQFTRASGWMYYAMASEHGVHVALTKDEGKTWEPLGSSHGAATGWLDLGLLASPPVWAGSFTDVEAGDDDRVALSFFGLEETAANRTYLRSDRIYNCDERQEDLVWRSYIAASYDAGQTWTVKRVSDDPVQLGGMYDVVVDGSGACRNLLDFKDMDIDSNGRMVIGFADGCTRECASTLKTGSQGYRDRAARVMRQTEGRGLFAKSDVATTATDLDADGIPNDQDPDRDGDGIANEQDPDSDGDGTTDTGKGTPLPAFVPLAAMLLAALAFRRRA